MNNKEIKKPSPEELNPEELSMVTGGDSSTRSLPLPANAVRLAPPATNTNTVTDGSTCVGACAKCRKSMSKDQLYSYNGKKYCRVCFMTFV